MSPYLAEFCGTAFMLYLGDSVNANVILKGSKGQNSGWTVISIGWAVAVLIPALMFGPHSGAHMNPALTLGLAANGSMSWALVPGYIIAQLAGAFTGCLFVYLHYKQHLDAHEDPNGKLGTFATMPAIRCYHWNFVTEFLATFALVFTIIGIGQTTVGGPAALGTFGVAAIIIAMGMGLGGPTGFAINPARDLGARIAHFVLPIAGKRDSDWAYSWLPVVAPACGGIVAALAASAIFP